MSLVLSFSREDSINFNYLSRIVNLGSIVVPILDLSSLSQNSQDFLFLSIVVLSCLALQLDFLASC